MEKEKILEALKSIRNKKRKFSQSVDLVVSLKELDLKKPEHQVDFFITLPADAKKKTKICAHSCAGDWLQRQRQYAIS